MKAKRPERRSCQFCRKRKPTIMIDRVTPCCESCLKELRVMYPSRKIPAWSST